MQWSSSKPEGRRTSAKPSGSLSIAQGLATTTEVLLLFTPTAIATEPGKYTTVRKEASNIRPDAETQIHGTIEANISRSNNRKAARGNSEEASAQKLPSACHHQSSPGSRRKGSEIYKAVINKIEIQKLHQNIRNQQESTGSIEREPRIVQRSRSHTSSSTSSSTATLRQNSVRSLITRTSSPLSKGNSGRWLDKENGEHPHFETAEPAEIHTISEESTTNISDPLQPLAYPPKDSVLSKDSSPSSVDNPHYHTMEGLHDYNSTNQQLSSEKVQEPQELPDNPDRSPSLEDLMNRFTPVDLSGEVTLKPGLPIATGWFASVYYGLWNNKPVAIKVITAQKNVRSPTDWKFAMERRLRREISVWAALSHPNIIEFYGYATIISDFPVMVSKWCRNGNSAQYLSRNPKLPHQDRFRLTQDVARGLYYLHSLKVIHGNLKPQNVLISDEGAGQICNLGLARLAEWHGPSGLTTTTPYGGTERYKAPELFRSRLNRDPKPSFGSDVYALGCIIYEFIHLKPPHHEFDTIDDLLEAIKDGEPPAPTPTPDILELPAAAHLWRVLEACWKRVPSERPSVNDLVFDLDAIYEMRYGQNKVDRDFVQELATEETREIGLSM